MGATYLAFDFGTKKFGVAVGQVVTATATALPIMTVNNQQTIWQQIDALLQQWQPAAIIVGVPLNMDTTEHNTEQLAQDFVAQLRMRVKIPVHVVDERLSTKMARAEIFGFGGYKALQHEPIDSYAAKLLLEDWLQNLKT